MSISTLVKRHSVAFALLMFIAWVFALFAPVAIAWADAPEAASAPAITRTLLKDRAALDSEAYRNAYQIPVASSSSSDDIASGHPSSNAFDNDYNTRWESQSAGTISITATFAKVERVDRFIYRANLLNLGSDGYPQKLTVLASASDDGAFTTVGTIESAATEEQVVFNFSERVQAKRIQLVFENGYYDGKARASEIRFLGNDDVLYAAEHMFANDHLNQLKPAYRDAALINRLKSEAQSHPLKDYVLPRLEIAGKIITGEIDKTDRPDRVTDFPVHVIQRTGNDAERIVFVFVGEGYTASQQEQFKSDITERAQEILTREPYKRYASMINMYAICVESNESDVYSYPHDTYFKIQYNVNGVDRLSSFTNDGQAKLTALIDQLKEKYLDPGAKVLSTSVLCNSWYYFGGGGQYAIASLQSGTPTLMHEMSHSFANLADEYVINSQGDFGGAAVNKTSNSDPATVKWKEWLAFGNVGVYGDGGGQYYIPTYYCIMRDLQSHPGYCPICEAHVDEVLNGYLPDALKHQAYVSNASLTLYVENPENYTRTDVNETTFLNLAKDEKLEWRAMVKNYTKQTQRYTMTFTVKGADGAAKHTVSKVFDVEPGAYNATTRETAAQSLSVVTDTLSDLVQGDTYEGTLVDASGKVVASTAGVPYKTLTVSYKISGTDGAGTQAVPGFGTEKFTVPAGSFTVKGTEIPGYVYVGSSAGTGAEGGTINVTEDTEITYYYARSKGKVSLKLVDSTGATVAEGERWVKYGATFTPSAGDFADYKVPAGFRVKAPAAVTFDGVNDAELTYTLEAIPADEAGIGFLGGSLRYSTEPGSPVGGLRLGFTFALPAGATPVWDQSGWEYGLAGSTDAGTRSVQYFVQNDDGTYTANIVFTDIKAADYDKVLSAKPYVAYRLSGQTEVKITPGDVQSRSVDQVASAMVEQGSEKEKAFGQAVLARKDFVWNEQN